jgi:tetratricopeptide (TPR) repeat protein
MTLSLCMIVKNEERHLRRCLESVRGLADDLVVVDTGSTDGTIEIARDHGARLFRLDWHDDFSIARNFSLEEATGDWILVLDADESIASRDHDPIRACMRRAGIHAVRSATRNYLDTGAVVGWQPGPGGYDEGIPYAGYYDVPCRRLFVNQPWLRFKNAVHEELHTVDPGLPFVEAHATWIIHHYGKADEQSRVRAKGERYLRIGLLKIQDKPDDPLAHYELGIQHRTLGKPGDAIPWFERALALSPHYRDADLQLALCWSELEDHEQALAALAVSQRHLPQYAAEIALAVGNIHRERDEPEAAERAYRHALSTRPAYGPATLGLAGLLAGQQRFSEAVDCLDDAIVHNPADVDCRIARARVRLAMGDEETALQDLDRIGSRGVAPLLRGRIFLRRGRFREAQEALRESRLPPDAESLGLSGAAALGMGHVGEAVALLESSLGIAETAEAAINLARARRAEGDIDGAARAAAQALRQTPEEDAARTLFADLMERVCAARDTVDGARPLTFYFYQPVCDDTELESRPGLVRPVPASVLELAEALRRRGHRCVMFSDQVPGPEGPGIECAPWRDMPFRCLSDRPDVLVTTRDPTLVTHARIAPLQVLWIAEHADGITVDRLPASGNLGAIDFVVCPDSAQVGPRDDLGVPPARWLPALSRPELSEDTDAFALRWETMCRAALAPEPVHVARIAKHVAEGRAELARRILAKEAKPADLESALWDALKALADWKAGAGPQPPHDVWRLLAVHVRSWRRSGLL